MKTKNKIRILASLGVLITVSMFLLGQNIGVFALPYNQGPFSGFTAGTYGVGNDDCADPTTRGYEIPAYHTQDASLDDIFVQVYVVGTGNNAMVRIAISVNGGSSFSSFEWVNTNPTVKQDFPDVQLYKDSADNNAIKAIVVWQEKPDDDSSDWKIKLRERCFHSNMWGSVQSVSNSIDNEQSIYPKISTCSDPDNTVSYWNVVWQKESGDFSNRFGVHLRRYVRGSGTEYWKPIESIVQPNNYSEDYKHPATDCVSQNYETVFIIYDQYHSYDSIDNRIKLAYGSPIGDKWGDIQIYHTTVDSSDDGDYSQNYPDIAAVKLDDSIILDCVWIENDGYNDEVYYKRSTDGGNSFGTEELIDDDGSMELRSVAIDSFISVIYTYIPPRTIGLCHVIWTTGTDIYYKDKTLSSGTWENFDNNPIEGTISGYNEEFVDVSTSAPTPSVITAYAVWEVDGTAVFFGWV